MGEGEAFTGLDLSSVFRMMKKNHDRHMFGKSGGSMSQCMSQESALCFAALDEAPMMPMMAMPLATVSLRGYRFGITTLFYHLQVVIVAIFPAHMFHLRPVRVQYRAYARTHISLTEPEYVE
jgi:fructose-specific phosphotransferase system IIC component